MKDQDRRRFLQQMLLGAAAAPLAPLLYDGAHAQAGGAPLRVMVLYTGFGGRWEHIRPRLDGLSFLSDVARPAEEPPQRTNLALTPEALRYEGSALAPLADYASKMTIIEGLAMSESLFEDSHIVGHERAPANAFTGGRPRETGEGNLSTGPSLEYVLGARLGEETAQRSLRVGFGASVSRGHYDTVAFDDRGDRLPGLTDTQATYDLLFDGFVPDDAEPDPGAERAAEQDQRVVDALLAGTGRLRGRLSGREEAKLTQHMDALRDIERRLGGGTLERPMSCGQPMPPGTNPAANGAEMNEHTDVMMDIIAQAFACDRTRYVSGVWGTNASTFAPWLLSDVDDWHNQVAHVVDADDAQGALAVRQMGELHHWYASQLAGFMDRLDAVEEGEGTLLDNTLIVWAQDFGQTAHSGVNVPYILLGGGADKFNMGRYMSFYEPAEHSVFGTEYSSRNGDSYEANNKLLNSVVEGAGLEDTSFGEVSGTLDGLLK